MHAWTQRRTHTLTHRSHSIDMGHWKDVWADAGDGRYNCTYPDGLTDMGRVLQLYTDTVRFSRNTKWMLAHLDPALRIGRYVPHSHTHTHTHTLSLSQSLSP